MYEAITTVGRHFVKKNISAVLFDRKDSYNV